MEYQRLITIDKNGNSIGRMCGTEQCRTIHKPNGCENCPMTKAIYAQLKFFEDAVEEEILDEKLKSTYNSSRSDTSR